jgi:hypothetical protein
MPPLLEPKGSGMDDSESTCGGWTAPWVEDGRRMAPVPDGLAARLQPDPHLRPRGLTSDAVALSRQRSNR